MNHKSKKFLKISFFLICLGVVLFFINGVFITDWRVKNSKLRVEKSIESNFNSQKEEFHNLYNYIHQLNINPFIEISFSDKNRFVGSLKSKLSSTEQENDLNGIFLSSTDNLQSDYQDFEINKNGVAKIVVADSTLEINNWTWFFDGGTNNKDYEMFVSYLGITKVELQTLSKMIQSLNCEAIRIDYNKDVGIRYDGHPWHQYEYLFNYESSPPVGYKKLTDEIFVGLHDNGLLCTQIIFTK